MFESKVTKEMREVMWDLEERFGEQGCEHCPYRERCQADELFWGCSVWELQIGEDL
jgi:hypothetical protein